MTILVVFHFDTKNPRLPCNPAALSKEFCGLRWSFVPAIVHEKQQTLLTFSFDVNCDTAPQAISDWSCDATIDFKVIPANEEPEKTVLQVGGWKIDSRRHVFRSSSQMICLRVPIDKLPKNTDDDGRYIVQLCITLNSLSELRPIQSFNFSNPSEQSNVIVDVGKRSFHVCKEYLSVYSTVLAEALRAEDNQHVVFDDVEEDDFQAMLENLYPTRKPVSASNIVSLLRMADRFSVDVLFEEANKFLHESLETGAMEKSQILDLAVRYQLNALKEKILASLKHPDGIAALSSEVSYHNMSSDTRALLFDNVVQMLPKHKSPGLFSSFLRSGRKVSSTSSRASVVPVAPEEKKDNNKGVKPAPPPKPPRLSKSSQKTTSPQV